MICDRSNDWKHIATMSSYSHCKKMNTCHTYTHTQAAWKKAIWNRCKCQFLRLDCSSIDRQCTHMFAFDTLTLAIEAKNRIPSSPDKKKTIVHGRRWDMAIRRCCLLCRRNWDTEWANIIPFLLDHFRQCKQTLSPSVFSLFNCGKWRKCTPQVRAPMYLQWPSMSSEFVQHRSNTIRDWTLG